jgi:hypothetical protein
MNGARTSRHLRAAFGAVNIGNGEHPEESSMELLIIPLVLLVIGARLVAGAMDGERIRRYIESDGGKLLEKQWAPFGKGWFGEQSDRIYEVRYLDRDGREREATCKTSLWTGVYWTDETVRDRSGGAPPPTLALEEENRRLKAENERLRVAASGAPPRGTKSSPPG